MACGWRRVGCVSHIPGSQHMLAWWIRLGVEPLDSGRGLVGLGAGSRGVRGPQVWAEASQGMVPPGLGLSSRGWCWGRTASSATRPDFPPQQSRAGQSSVGVALLLQIPEYPQPPGCLSGTSPRCAVPTVPAMVPAYPVPGWRPCLAQVTLRSGWNPGSFPFA